MGLNAKTIGLKIQEARLAKGMTQADLAKAMGLDRGTVVRWETGKAIPRKTGIPKIAKLLSKEPAWILEGSSELSPVVQNVEILRAERRTLKEIREAVKNLAGKVQGDSKSCDAIVAREVAPARGAKKANLKPAVNVDRKALEDITRAWDSARPEARIVAALLITGDWSYKLKLLNREISLDDEVIAALGNVNNY